MTKFRQLTESRRSSVAPFIAMDVFKAANERQMVTGDVLHLEVGQPSASAPQAVVAAAQQALQGNNIGYTEALGLRALRARIAEYYLTRHGVTITPERIIITTGSSGAFLLSFLSAFDVGDGVAIAEPGYPAYRNIVKALGLNPVAMQLSADNDFSVTCSDVAAAAAKSVNGVLVASPSNPTGKIIPEDELAAMVELCRSRGIWFISDEIYHGITYDAAAQTAAKYSDDVVVINSFSKYFCMTGWRLGWMVVPEILLRPIERLAQNLFICPPAISQFAAIAAFDCQPELDAIVESYSANRNLLLNGLPAAGFDHLVVPEGAFYIFADVRHLTDDSTRLCKEILDATGVALTPGLDFDPQRGKGYIRISFASATPEIAEALKRLSTWHQTQSR